jgi:hypothetical protein
MERTSRQPRKRKKSLAQRLVWLPLVIILGLAGLLFFRAMHPPDNVGGTAFSALSPEEQEKRRHDAQTLVKQVENLAKASKNNEHKPFEIVATEDQLNTLIQDRLQTQNLPVHNPRLGLKDGEITLQGDADYKGFSAPATVTGTLDARDGAVAFHVTSIKVGGFPAPSGWGEKVESKVSEALDKGLRGGKNGRIDSIEITDGQLKVSGQTG